MPPAEPGACNLLLLDEDEKEVYRKPIFTAALSGSCPRLMGRGHVTFYPLLG